MRGFLLATIAALAASSLFSTPAHARAKTDLVFIGKADRITGEIKQMSKGILTLSTDNIGTVYIEWEDVDSLSSVYQFRVEDQFAQKYFGSIFLTRGGALQVIRGGATLTTPGAAVVAITPLESSFWDRLDGSISIGFSYTKANQLAQLSSDFNVRYRTPLRLIVLDASSIATAQEDEETSNREELTITYNRLFESRWFAALGAGAETNDELGLDLRVNVAPGLGLNLVQTNHNTVTTGAGVSVNREWSSNSDGATNLEGFIAVEWATFRYDYPKTDITLGGTVFPGLSSWGRVRTDVDVSATRELISDLTVVLTFYHSHDNEPLDPDASRSDYGLVTSVGWTF